jgi:excinuclease ABC subunit A
MAEHVLGLPEGTTVEICAPVFKIYGEDYAYLLADVRTKGYRRMRIDDELRDISDDVDLDEAATYTLEAVIDKFVVKKQIAKHLLVSIENGLRVGEGFLRFRVLTPEKVTGDLAAWYEAFSCPEHHTTMGKLLPYYFSFNDGDSACPTCSGLGTYLKVHPDLLVPDKARSIAGGAFIPEAFKYDKNLWPGRLLYSVARHCGFGLDTPFKDLLPEHVEIVFYGTKGERFPLVLPPGATKGDPHAGKLFRFDGIIHQIERRYRHYRKKQVAHTDMEDYLRKVMVEHTCPDCRGTKLKRQRLLVTLHGRNIHELGDLSLEELKCFLDNVPAPARERQAGEQITREITSRLLLLLGIGLDYLNLNRRAMTLSGGESQRIRLSTQISSGLMGMLYVLDEPSIGLHPKDNIKLITTLKRLRDIGNTVIVVEHDEETIRAADYVVELGPGPGVHGGQIVAQGTLEDILRDPGSLTGQYLSGRRRIALPATRRKPREQALEICGARHNNLKNIDVEIPLGVFICVTGASGSGKSTLVGEILYKKLYSLFHDSRVLSGDHDAVLGTEYITDVINIDQSPIGRSPRSNPATYIGFYDEIRRLFADQAGSRARGYTASRFSFNLKGGRCEECGGEGLVTTRLHFMPDVESPCPVCKGTRYNAETLEVTYRGKNIAEVLDMTIEEGARFFQDHRLIAHKLGVLQDLGLGYVKLGQSSTTLSGGEAQRIKLAHELGKIKRGARSLYILDEPTTGLHLADIQRLLDSLNRLVDAGNTVLVIEHHLDVIKTADYLIDLGPDGGKHGGRVIARGTPEEIAQNPDSHTGRFLRSVLT